LKISVDVYSYFFTAETAHWREAGVIQFSLLAYKMLLISLNF